MKNMNQKYFTIAVYVLAVLAFSILFLLLGLNLGSFFSLIGNILDKLGSIFYGILFALELFDASLEFFNHRLFIFLSFYKYLLIIKYKRNNNKRCSKCR